MSFCLNANNDATFGTLCNRKAGGLGGMTKKCRARTGMHNLVPPSKRTSWKKEMLHAAIQVVSACKSPLLEFILPNGRPALGWEE